MTWEKVRKKDKDREIGEMLMASLLDFTTLICVKLIWWCKAENSETQQQLRYDSNSNTIILKWIPPCQIMGLNISHVSFLLIKSKNQARIVNRSKIVVTYLMSSIPSFPPFFYGQTDTDYHHIENWPMATGFTWVQGEFTFVIVR